MKQGNNKARDFAKYKEKWGLTNYRLVIAYKDVAVIPIEDPISSTHSGEIRTVHNLMKRRNSKFSLRENSYSDYLYFDNLQELLEYMLIKKIAL